MDYLYLVIWLCVPVKMKVLREYNHLQILNVCPVILEVLKCIKKTGGKTGGVTRSI